MNIDKQQLLTDSKTFCMFPWLHLNVTPKGNIYPCCSNDYTEPFGNTRDTTLAAAFNSDKMRQLRLDMLAGKQSKICDFCYKHEAAGPYSFRTYSIEQFAHRFDETVPTTEPDGTVPDFRMHYLDIRFSNICNFKCRTCGAEFSSQWAAENRLKDPKHPVIMHADDQRGGLLAEVLSHACHTDLAYFVGGESLITDEHYVILEELIRIGRTDITLRYNTNASHIKHKKHDVVELWKHFKRIELSCSIDHYGERAEWLRHGTDWGKVEANLLMFREIPHISFQLNTVFSLFNYLTIGEFYGYLRQRGIVRDGDWHHSLYLAVNPSYYCAQSLPAELKSAAAAKAVAFCDQHSDHPLLVNLITNAVSFADQADTWEPNRDRFRKMTAQLDDLRSEDFARTFPELRSMIDG